MLPILGPIISAGSNLLGGLFGRDAQKDANEAQMRMAQQNIDLQKQFAQNGIQWKVADAKAAGIHPLYALGASTPSFSPVTVGTTPETGLAEGFAKAGQDISRGIQATRTADQRAEAANSAMTALQLERETLNNELLRTQIASAKARLAPPQVGPPMQAAVDPYMIPGQTQSGASLIKTDPLKVAPAPADYPHMEGGAITDQGFARTTTGWAPVPSKDVKERIEDSFIPEFMWSMRNMVYPSFGFNYSPPPQNLLKPGHFWVYNALKQEYQQSRYPVSNRPWYRFGF